MHLKSDGSPVPRISREEKRQQTRLALRESALREFAQFGVAGTSAERIAEAARGHGERHAAQADQLGREAADLARLQRVGCGPDGIDQGMQHGDAAEEALRPAALERQLG